MEKYLKEFIEGLNSRSTKISYMTDLSDFFKYLNLFEPITELSQINVETHVEGFLHFLQVKGVAAKSIKRKKSTLKSYFAFLQKREVIQGESFNQFISKKTIKGSVSITMDDIEKVKTFIIEDKYISLKHRSLLLIVLTTGMKVCEIVNVKCIDFVQKEQTGYLHYRNTRNQFKTVIELEPELTYYLAKLVNEYKDNGSYSDDSYLFCPSRNPVDKDYLEKHIHPRTADAILKKWFKLSGIKNGQFNVQSIRNVHLQKSIEGNESYDKIRKRFAISRKNYFFIKSAA